MPAPPGARFRQAEQGGTHASDAANRVRHFGWDEKESLVFLKAATNFGVTRVETAHG
jgi:hypothetical protein